MLGQPCEIGSELNDSDLDGPDLDNIDDHSTTNRSRLCDAPECSQLATRF